MALRAEFSLVHSEFNEFLFAFVGEEKNGVQLTVLSAFARLGLDPWGEAARLSELPKDAATAALEIIISKFPDGNWAASESQSIASRLVNCLPKRRSLSARPLKGEPNAGSTPMSDTRKWLAWIGLAALVFFVVLYLRP